MEAWLKCIICLEVADEAVETKCCRQVYCRGCIDRVQRCAHCRKEPVRVEASALARRMIDSLPFKCPHCGQRGLRGEISTHEAVCEQRPIRCPAPDCSFEGLAPEFLVHLRDKHREALLNNAEKCFT